MTKISIVTPAFELGGRGSQMLTDLLKSLSTQTCKDFELVVSDHSVGNELELLCDQWRQHFPITYVRYDKHRGSCEANLNNAIDHAKGEFIKPLLQDDFFVSNEAIEMMTTVFSRGARWLATGCKHCREDDTGSFFNPHVPRWDPTFNMALGYNLIGSPSVVAFPRGWKFDHNLLWLMDCCFYYEVSRVLGPPILMSEILVGIRFRDDSISSTMITPYLIAQEQAYIESKLLTDKPRPLTDFPLVYERVKKCGLV